MRKFLWNAAQSNYDNGNYQFAFLAYHMLTMSFVYFNIWQIKQTKPEDFKKVLIGCSAKDEENLRKVKTPFDFSVIQERTILRFLRLIECDEAKIGMYAKLVTSSAS